MKLQQTKGRYNITLPKSYIQLLKWQKGKELVIVPNQAGELVIKELKP